MSTQGTILGGWKLFLKLILALLTVVSNFVRFNCADAVELSPAMLINAGGNPITLAALEEQPDNLPEILNGIAPSPANTSADLSKNYSLILAANRTNRPDILNKFCKYKKGWNIRDQHYWTSAMFTGLPGFVLASCWLSFGSFSLLSLHCWYCCSMHRGTENKEDKQFSLWFPLLILIWVSLTTVVGCGLVYTGQGKLNDELFHTMTYVVNQSRYTVDNLHNVSVLLTEAATIDLENVVIPPKDISKIHELSVQLNSSAAQLQQNTQDKAPVVRHAIYSLRLVMIAVAGMMLLITLLGLLSVACGLRSFTCVLVCTGWLLVAGTWTGCGAFIVLSNAMEDTCFAMEEWVVNPDARTNLDDVLPCVDKQTANQTLYKSQDLTYSVVAVVNQAIDVVFNNNLQPGEPYFFNQSGPLLPRLCSPYGQAPAYTPQACPLDEVDFQTAPANWSQRICTDDNGTCTSTGRLTQKSYHKLIESVSISNGLYVNVPFLISVENCVFIRDTFQTIISDHCSQFQKYSRWVWIGMMLVSEGSMLAILLWILISLRLPLIHASWKACSSILVQKSMPSNE